MKISQMTTDQAADVLIRISVPVANIMHDDETIKVLEDVVKGSNDPFVFIADNIVPVTMVLLKDHREDVFEIVSALAEKSAEEVAKQKLPETIKDIKNSWDGELVDFFASLKK